MQVGDVSWPDEDDKSKKGPTPQTDGEGAGRGRRRTAVGAPESGGTGSGGAGGPPGAPPDMPSTDSPAGDWRAADVGLGIDFGTANCRMAIEEKSGWLECIAPSEGTSCMPSAIGLDKNGVTLAGHWAKKLLALQSDRSVTGFKRGFGTVGGVILADQHIELIELTAMLFRKLKADAEARERSIFGAAVVAVPDCFTGESRGDIKAAALRSGFTTVTVIDESQAILTALNEGSPETTGLVAILDVGAGFIKAYALNIGDGVLVTHETVRFGALDIDEQLAEFLVADFEQQQRMPVRDAVAWQRFVNAAQVARHELSAGPSIESARISLPFIVADETGPKHYDRSLSRLEFESINGQLVERACLAMTIVLQRAGIANLSSEQVVLLGEASRCAALEAALRERFGLGLIRPQRYEHCIAFGCAILAAGDKSMRTEDLVDKIKALGEERSELHLKNAMELKYGVQFETLTKEELSSDLRDLFEEPLMRKHKFIPISRHGERVRVAMVDPWNEVSKAAILSASEGRAVEFALCLEDELLNILDLWFRA